MAQSKFETVEIINDDLSIIISDFLQSDHSAKAHAKRAKEAKDKVLQFDEINPASPCHYKVANKTGKVNYRVTYKTHKVVHDTDVLAEIERLKAEIKRLEDMHGVDEFWYFGLNEIK